MKKKDLRKIHLTIRNRLNQEEIKEKSKKIFENLSAFPNFKAKNNIMTYVSFGTEVYTHRFIEDSISKGKNIVVPLCDPSTKELILSSVLDMREDLKRSNFGILEPKKGSLRLFSQKNLEIILVPGLAFTEGGTRLGYGGGYYDRFLSTISKKIPKIALAFELQIVKDLPEDSYDVPMDYIFTEKRIIQCKKGYLETDR